MSYVLIACEFSGVVRDAFRARGVDAVSCDILPTERPDGPHYQCDVRDLLGLPWDLIVAFPPCTDLAASGARWWPEKIADGRQQRAHRFVESIWRSPAKRVVIENPVGALSRLFRKPTQTIQPWQHGHGEVKTTHLWIRGLPPLEPSNVVEGRHQKVWLMGETKGRAKERSRTYAGVAEAMAEQWAPLLTSAPSRTAR